MELQDIENVHCELTLIILIVSKLYLQDVLQGVAGHRKCTLKAYFDY